MIAEATVISAMTSVNAALRPARSAYMPINTPPIGRTMNALPNTARLSIREIAEFAAGKNCLEMITDRKPYTMKSYHSNALPILAAMIARRSCLKLGMVSPNGL